MHKGDNQGGDRQDIVPEEIKQNNREKILEEIQSIRNSVENLKKEIAVPEGAEAKPQQVEATPKQAEPILQQADAAAEPTPQQAEPILQQADAAAEPTLQQVEVKPEEQAVKNTEKLIKAIVEEERELERQKPDEVSDFATKYKDHMKRQVSEAEADEKQKKRTDRFIRKEAARKERDHQKAVRAENKRRKKEEDEARKKERRARAKELQQKRAIRAEVRRKKRIAARSAKYGGGVVQYHDTEVSTEIQPVAKFSLMDLLGFAHRDKIKAAETEEEKRSLQKEQEQIAEDARQAASHLSKVRATKFRNSATGRFLNRVGTQAEAHKKILLSILGIVLLIVAGAAGYFNYYTLYEYSYNGHVLGYVKDKDDVLRITDMVQEALTTDKDIQVVIDDKDDISFRRVSSQDKEIEADNPDQVLRRLTYMGDLNVKAWGIYVNGRKEGSVRKKSDAADVLKMLEDRYSSGKEGAVIEKAEVQEDIEVKKSNTDLRNVLSSEKMTDKLCTADDREIIHTIVAEETLKDIADEYQVTTEDLLLQNESVDPKNLVAGDTILIRKTAPPVTVRITEKRTYEQKIKYETEEKRTDEMYEGEVIIKQEGKNGREKITERTVSINGEVAPEDIEILERDVMRKAVKKVMIVGTAERPPSVGDGKYIWPMEPGYSLSSHFGYRWGRMHSGIDLAGSVGHDIYAADGGIVTRAGYFGGYGLCIDIDHQNGQSSRYAHLSQTLVSPGDEVYEGMVIAKSGNTGNSTGPHLHFEIHIGGSAVDPLGYLP